jgi:hypothetical protein
LDREEREEESSTKKRRKRKRKEGSSNDSSSTSLTTTSTSTPTTTTSTTTPELALQLKPRDDTAVQLEIKNIRELVSGASTSPTSDTTLSSSSTSFMSSTTTDRSSSKDNRAGIDLRDSLEQLLEDARRMKEDDSATGEAGGRMSDEEDKGLNETIRNVLSTIVTADFFVVCGFLLWFLAGIVWRAVFNDDSVQIAFNSK